MSESTWNPFLQLVRPSQWKIKKQSRLLLGRYRRIETEWWPNQSAKESTIFAPPPLIVTGSSFPLKRTQPTKSLAAFQEWKKKISVKTNLSFFFSLLVYLKDFHVLFFFHPLLLSCVPFILLLSDPSPVQRWILLSCECLILFYFSTLLYTTFSLGSCYFSTLTRDMLLYTTLLCFRSRGKVVSHPPPQCVDFLFPVICFFVYFFQICFYNYYTRSCVKSLLPPSTCFFFSSWFSSFLWFHRKSYTTNPIFNRCVFFNSIILVRDGKSKKKKTK